MTSPKLLQVTRMIMLIALQIGCSKHPVISPAAQIGVASATEMPGAATICDVVTADEMSKLLGSPVTAKTQRLASACTYPSVAEFGPNAELRIERGDGEAGMQGVTFLNQFESGATDPLAGLGDQAIRAGPMIMVRRGDDLICIMVSGLEDSMAAVKRIYAAVDAKMGR